jgi:pyruvate/2-oxoglutarate dehydrogenase complex dihydrolipoamide acyltransferase (E2) component
VATEVILPRLGQGMESGTIVRWLKSEGEPVAKGEPLFELDTDKVTQEVEAEAAGVLLKIAVAEGEVPVGQTAARVGARPARRGAAGGGGRVGQRPDQGLAARAPHRAGTRHRALRDPRHGPGRPHRRRGRRARRGRRPGGAARRARSASERRGRAHPALEHPQDDRPPAHRGVADPGLPAPGLGRHDTRERARREAPRP